MKHFIACLLVTLIISPFAEAAEKARVVSFHGYDDCIRLENGTTRVTLGTAGGRVLEYAYKGQNVLYLSDDKSMSAGRFDIGPEQIIPRHPELWSGKWTGSITGPRSARLTSVKDTPTGVQLVRDFRLDEKSSRLECKQTIKNVSEKTVEYCHWSRTFALGGGICLIPLTEPRRFPNGYVMYDLTPAIMFRPVDPNIRVRDGFLEITGAPKFPKLGMDTREGWFAYLMKNDLMFVKEFPVFPERSYNEVAGLTMSIWYPNRPMVELEPIGPREKLTPGESSSFTETWRILPQEFPGEGERVDIRDVVEKVGRGGE